MDRKVVFLIIIGLFSMAGWQNAMSQPAVDGFMKGKGNLDVVPGLSVENFSNYFGRLNELTSIKRTSISLNMFSAVGITNWLDAQVNIPYVFVTEEFKGFQDFSGYLKGALINKYYENGSNFRLMITGGVSFPMSDYETESQYAIGQQAKAIDGRIVVQYTKSNGFFIMGQGGYTHRDEPVASSYPAAIKVGWAKVEHYIDIYYDQQIAIGGNDYLDYREELKEFQETDITFQSLGVSYGKIGATYYKPWRKNWGLSLGGSYVLWGRNVGQSIMVSASFVKRFPSLW